MGTPYREGTMPTSLIVRLRFVVGVAGAVACTEGDELANVAPPAPQRTAQIVSGDGQRAEVGTLTSEPLIVRLVNVHGAPIAGAPVVFRGEVARVDSAVTDASGMASVRWTLPERAGAYSVEASSSEGSKPPIASARVVFRVTAVPGQPQRLDAVSGDSGVVAVGSQLDTLVVRVVDRFGNSVAGVPVAWDIESGGGTVTPSALSNDVGLAAAVW